MKSQFSAAIFALAVLSLLALGCHRGYYRRQADAEAIAIIQQKSNDPRWGQLDPSIEIDARSRMFDPFSADHPPLPPDDPASHKLMEFTDCKRNFPHWHANGDTQYVENPEWAFYLPLNEKGELVLDLQKSVELAILHSSEYQEEKEDLYLSALNVSLERFGFDTQLFANLNGDFTSNGSAQGGGNTLTLGNNNATLQRLGVTGTNLAVAVANSIMWNFAGPNNQSASTLIDFTLIQPLLRGAGRERIMEALTQSERTLLSDVRALDRFHRGFFLSITTGRAPTSVFATGGAGGFLGILRDIQDINIQERNVKDQEDILEQFRAFFDEQRIDLLQVTQVQSNLYQAQRSLALSKNNLKNSLDAFKIDLGIPPEIPVVIDDPFLDQFNLISPEVNALRNSITALRDEASNALTELNSFLQENQFDVDLNLDGDQHGVNWSDEIPMALEKLIPSLEKIKTIRESVLETVVPDVEKDFDVLDEARPRRVESLRALSELVQENPDDYDIDRDILNFKDIASSEQLIPQLESSLEKLDRLQEQVDQTIGRTEQLIEDGSELDAEALYNEVVENVLRVAPELMTSLSNYILEISLVQATARTDSIQLPAVDIEWETAIDIARRFRRDWMNARAALVDEWRNIEFVADQLESELDIVFEGDIGNIGDNPFRLRDANGSLSVGLSFDAPINRIAERNSYRQALINYQQARRNYYQFKDTVKQNLRQTIRSIELNKILFELDRRSVRVAVQEVELARLRLEEPVQPPSALSTNAGGLGGETARDLTIALNSLQQTQISLLNTWVNYEAQRRGLDFDLGTMQVTPDGFWLDPGEIDNSIADRAEETLGVACGPASSEIEPYQIGNDQSDPDYSDEFDSEEFETEEELPTGTPEDPSEGGLLDPRSEDEILQFDDQTSNQPRSGRSALVVPALNTRRR